MAGSVGQYTQDWMPVVGYKAATAGIVPARQNLTDRLGMGRLYCDAVLNDILTLGDFWFDTGTWKICFVYDTNTAFGICTVLVDGSSVGTFDEYTAVASANQFVAITGISVTTPGVKSVAVKMATKNGSSAGYNLALTSVALIRTAGTSSAPGGSDSPGYTWVFLPWMGSNTNTTFDTRNQSATYIGGGSLRSSGQNAEVTWSIWLEAGTYKFAAIYTKSTDYGIYSVQLDTVEKGTIDGYIAVPVANNYSEITGITVATAGVKEFKLKMATKNASSTNYAADIQAVGWFRTGA